MIPRIVTVVLFNYLLGTAPVSVYSSHNRTDTRSTLRVKPHILDGHEAELGEIPYQLQLIEDGIFTCGASIICKKWALTAAHCVDGVRPKSLELISGSLRRNEQGEGTRHPIERVVVHFFSDIALIKVADPFQFNDHVQPIALPVQGEEVTAGTLCIVSGWGKLQEGSAKSYTLQTVEIPIVSYKMCLEWLKRVDPKTEICAGLEKGGKDACQGDSGGPLVAGNKQVGIISWGIGCGRRQLPGVYIKVSAFRDWIQRHTGI